MRKYKMPDWAEKQVVRWDRNNMVEDICKHGVGHPNKEWMQENKGESGIHGCCSCCLKKEKKHD